eukprot:20707-Rhodomonas_salina.2
MQVGVGLIAGSYAYASTRLLRDVLYRVRYAVTGCPVLSVVCCYGVSGTEYGCPELSAVCCYRGSGTECSMLLPGTAAISVMDLHGLAPWVAGGFSVRDAIRLRAPYAVSGTDIAHGAIRLRHVR